MYITHVIEPKYPGAVERYVNLGDCYDYRALGKLREEIISCMADYPACYDRAYRCLDAAFDLREDVRAALLTPQLTSRLARRARGILRRELKPKKGEEKGTVTRRFLSAMTHKGPLALFDTVDALCPRVYVLQDRWGLGHELLIHLLTGAVEGGFDAVVCPSPMAPERLEHLLIPAVGLAFVTSTPALPYPGCGVRTIRLDAGENRAPERSIRPRLRFALKVSAALEGEAVVSLAQAKQLHDQLEALYNPHVDFDRVNEIADEVIGEILALAESR